VGRGNRGQVSEGSYRPAPFVWCATPAGFACRTAPAVGRWHVGRECPRARVAAAGGGPYGRGTGSARLEAFETSGRRGPGGVVDAHCAGAATPGHISSLQRYQWGTCSLQVKEVTFLPLLRRNAIFQMYFFFCAQ
jgi:hypothetical protein